MIRRRANRRPGAHVVEAAIVLPTLMLFLFGVFEYGRYISCLQVVENAAREGARMAVAHTNDKGTADVQARVRERLAGMDRQISPMTITVGGIILQPKDSTEVAGQALPDWTEASSTDGVSVQVAGTYRPILASMLRMPTTIPISVTCVMYSEGN